MANTDRCPKCGNDKKERMVKMSSLNRLDCSICGTTMVWQKEAGQPSLIPNNRETRKVPHG